jgi:hypothetical protein
MYREQIFITKRYYLGHVREITLQQAQAKSGLG